MPGILHARLTALLKEANLVEGSLKTFEVEFELLHAPEAHVTVEYDAERRRKLIHLSIHQTSRLFAALSLNSSLT